MEFASNSKSHKTFSLNRLILVLDHFEHFDNFLAKKWPNLQNDLEKCQDIRHDIVFNCYLM
jgi:hypothetical protein